MPALKVSLEGKELKRYRDRVKHRKFRHNNWRQVYVDCCGMCQFPVGDDAVCSETDSLEFHEIYGEAKNGEVKLQQRVLLCNYHHYSIHGEKWVNERHYPSMLQFDVELEILACGSYRDWLDYFNLIDRKVDYDLSVDTTQNKTDINDSKDS